MPSPRGVRGNPTKDHVDRSCLLEKCLEPCQALHRTWGFEIAMLDLHRLRHPANGSARGTMRMWADPLCQVSGPARTMLAMLTWPRPSQFLTRTREAIGQPAVASAMVRAPPLHVSVSFTFEIKNSVPLSAQNTSSACACVAQRSNSKAPRISGWLVGAVWSKNNCLSIIRLADSSSSLSSRKG